MWCPSAMQTFISDDQFRSHTLLVEAEIVGEDEKTLLGILTPFDLLYAPRFQVQQA